jgi:diguanylate cyclase (GGDEF)-like protein
MNRRRIRDTFGMLVDGRHFDDDVRVRFWMLGSGEPLSALMADLDHFGEVNTKFGHSKGDDAMRVYLSIVRDVAAAFGGEGYRTGGDETISILPGADEEVVTRAAESLRKAVEDAFRGFSPGGVDPTCSIGIATFESLTAPLEVRDTVDRRMYAAKDSGRNRVVGSG